MAQLNDHDKDRCRIMKKEKDDNESRRLHTLWLREFEEQLVPRSIDIDTLMEKEHLINLSQPALFDPTSLAAAWLQYIQTS